MGLAWQQGPLASGAIGRFLVADPLPERLLYATQPLVLFESGFAPRGYVPRADVDESALTAVEGHGVDRDLSLGAAPPGGRL
jgi:hypothetical protein